MARDIGTVIDVGSLDDVITKLEAIVDQCRSKKLRAGYFAAMYLGVTRKIEQAIENGEFENETRMIELDRVFAQRYIDAFAQDQRGERPSKAWETSFEGTHKRRPIIVQQLLTGMNAHINLDLGIAAATVAPGEALSDLHRDFDTINGVLATMTRRFINDVVHVSPWIGVLDRLGGRTEQHVIKFSIDIARDEAWRLASDLAPLTPAQWATPIAQRDLVSAGLGALILHPGVLMSAGLLVIRSRESNDVARVIDVFLNP